ncbi:MULTISPECIES: BrnA antitoxin family protein [Mycetohabitans]|nr:BrnA antitoxin family protein [Mycetohabitans sp. B3]
MSHDVVTGFKAYGSSWQTRIDAALSGWLKAHKA